MWCYVKKHSDKNSDSYLNDTIEVPSFIEQPINVVSPSNSNDNIISKMLENENIVDLSTAKANWYFGEWQALVELDIQSLSNHPDVDKLAALKAAAYQQLNDIDKSKTYFKLAKDLGCDNYLISQLLIAGVHNALGKVAALKSADEKILSHFSAAVDVGGKTQDNKLAMRARSVKEMTNLGLLPQVASLINEEVSLLSTHKNYQVERGKQLSLLNKDIEQLNNELLGYKFNSNLLLNKTEGQSYENAPEFCENTLRLHQERENSVSSQPPSILLDSKSLPRSGLHYLKDTLQEVLGDHFSFCEWYQEPNCCKKMPCTKELCSNDKSRNGVPLIRLLKSHDFNLTDPDYPTSKNIRRIILHRDPLFALTSYFVLDQLTNYRNELEKQGIKLENIWLAHSKEDIAEAYKVMDKNFKEPHVDDLQSWLKTKEKYISEFMIKWRSSTNETRFIKYESINLYVLELLTEVKPWVTEDVKNRIDAFSGKMASNFSPRNDPFTCKSMKLSDFLRNNTNKFTDIANALNNDGAIKQ